MPLVKVIQSENDRNVLAYKYPDEELNTLTQLVVREYEEAVLFKDGQACDLFTAGRYTLDTPNIPILNKIINIPFGGKSPFKAEVWFVNKTYTLDLKWGTRTPILLQDPKYSILIPVRAFGQFGIQVENSKKCLIKLVGKIDSFSVESLRTFFKGLYLTKVKDSISSYLVKKKISVTEINAYIDEISEYTKSRMEPIFDEYGIKLVNFYINDISVSEEDPAVQQLKVALAKRAEMDIIGYDYRQERSFNTLENISKNNGTSSEMINLGVGLATAANLTKTIGSEIGKVAGNLNTEGTSKQFCTECGQEINGDFNYCPKCGKKIIK